MASRSLRLLLLAIVLEVFALVFATSPFGDYWIIYAPQAIPVGRYVVIAVGVIGLLVALAGFFTRD